MFDCGRCLSPLIITVTTISLQLILVACQPSCMQNYEHYDYVTSTCMPCPTSCLSCFDSSACTACISEYFLDSNNSCRSCPFGCAVCTDSATCTTCQPGLYINAEGNCIPCAMGVKSCTIALIESCKDGYFMLGSICAGCMDNCKTCSDFVACTLCVNGFYVDSSNGCTSCSNNCDVCQNSSLCTSCEQGYILSGGSCSPPNCTSISPFCQKCANGQCQQCSFGKYVNSNGTCSQGSSLLCLSASGPYHTNCQTNLYGCPDYANVQIDSISGNQLPVCLPMHASQDKQYQYSVYKQTVCPVASASGCASSFNKTFTFSVLKPFYQLNYRISLKLYSSATHQVVVNFTDTNGSVFKLHTLNLSAQYTQNIQDGICHNCPFSFTVIDGSVQYSGFASNSSLTSISLKSTSSLFIVSQFLIWTSICKVSRCASCTTAIDCVQCDSPYYLQLISCVQQCDAGFYKYGMTCVLACPSQAYPIQSSYECSKCASPCLTCVSQTQCLSCVNGFFLDGTTCATTCSKLQLFTNITSGNCEPCPNPCTQCSVSVSSSNSSSWSVSCIGCGVGYLLQGGNCTYICPTGTFANFVNNKTQCSPCVSGCSSCSISDTICLGCSSNYLLDGSTCHLNYTCPQGYFINNTINSCQKCHFPCQTCSLMGTNCTSCLKGSLYNNTCPLVCPSGMFISYTQSHNDQVCLSCNSPCVECLSQTLCLSCVNGTFLFNSLCLLQCPVQTYYESSADNSCLPCLPPCYQCITGSECLSCTTGYIDLSTHKCTLQCNATSYPDSNFVCQSCALPCIRCYSSVSCSMCQLPHVLYNQSCITSSQCQAYNQYVHYNLNYSDPTLSQLQGICLQCTYPCASCNASAVVCKSCVSGYLFVGDLSTCVQSCPLGYYKDGSACLKCDSNCLGCNATATTCVQCGTGMYLYNLNSTCLLICPSQYYGSNEEQTCKSCQSPCLECYNAYLCKSCSVGVYYNKACVSSCPSGSIHNTSSNICEPCTNNCLSCSVLTSNCTQCPTNGFYYYQYQCLTFCPTLYYADELSHNCELCVQPCKECITATQCSTCVTGYYYVGANSDCTTVCPEGYYADTPSSTCLACNTTICRTCSASANNCTQCASGYFYHYNTSSCVQVCPNGTYADTLYLQCRECQYPCLVCQSQNSCIVCHSSYKLYLSNCYSQCPRGFFTTSSNTCDQCASICQVCTSLTVCKKCTQGYYVNASSACVQQCQLGYYKGFDALSSYATCIKCPSECLSCQSAYNCTQCQSAYFLFNGICAEECPSLYYSLQSPTSNSSSCSPCAKYCNKCLNSTYCLQCLNSYIYLNQCYASCPAATYTFNQEQCINCTSPCVDCTGRYSCLTCIPGYFYFQNYCVQKCPDDVWKYPQNNSCYAECPYNKYVQLMQCYVNGCGGMLVHNNGYCLDSCPIAYYVDANQNCIRCDTSDQARNLCKKIFEGDLQILRSYNLKAVIYFNQLINNENVNLSKIETRFYDKNDNSVAVQYEAVNVYIDSSMLLIEFGYRSMQLYSLQVKIPYVVSKQSEQSIFNNLFKGSINSYNDYQYSGSYAKTQSQKVSSKVGSSSSQQSEESSQLTNMYSPSAALNALAIVVVCGAFLCMVVNVVCKGTHYRQLVDFLQFVAASLYLQIQYPPILQSYLKNIKISLFSFLPQIANFQPYAFSPSKFIEYHKDSSLLRSQGLLFIIFIATLISFVIAIAINKHRPEKLVSAVRRIKYKNITDLFSVLSLPLLIFSFRFTSSHPADIVISIVVICLVIGFVIMMSYLLVTAKSLQQIAGLAGDLQQTQSVLGHMYTPFAFVRKIIFGLVLCIQPDKPISTLTLLLIFTILIMVCLFFYQPFQNQITDYICISMEIVLIIYVAIVILFGLNALQGLSGHNLGIAAAAFTLVGAVVGLFWLLYLTYGAVDKFRKEAAKEQQSALQEGLNNQPVNASKYQTQSKAVTSFVRGQSQVNKQPIEKKRSGLKDNNMDEDEPSASQLIKGHRHSKLKEQIQIESNESENVEQFRHWNNSQSSQKQSEADGDKKAPKYLLKMEKDRNQQ